ncbi:MAG: hypothetical protein FJ264_00165 [Planctomycetes bacterium]|nr:hypothetical protein [Planctomycetota bacterium]
MSKYIKYELTSDILCIGERVKKGTYKPCIKTIPFSTITGALRDTFNFPGIYALGKLDSDYLKNIDQYRQIHIYSPRYVFEDVSKVPLQIEFITDVKALVYVFLKDMMPEHFIEKKENQNFDITMGAFKSKGFGKCHLHFTEIIENPEIKLGTLQSRIPETANCMEYFGIKSIKKYVYGYLFEPTTKISGKYIKSLFEGSVIEGCEFLLEEDK